MPIYEYQCADCGTKFGLLRPMSKADSPAACSQCGSDCTSRAISLFSAVSKGSNGGSDGGSRSITGGGCASCAAHNCSTCGH